MLFPWGIGLLFCYGKLIFHKRTTKKLRGKLRLCLFSLGFFIFLSLFYCSRYSFLFQILWIDEMLEKWHVQRDGQQPPRLLCCFLSQVSCLITGVECAIVTKDSCALNDQSLACEPLGFCSLSLSGKREEAFAQYTLVFLRMEANHLIEWSCRWVGRETVLKGPKKHWGDGFSISHWGSEDWWSQAGTCEAKLAADELWLGSRTPSEVFEPFLPVCACLSLPSCHSWSEWASGLPAIALEEVYSPQEG